MARAKQQMNAEGRLFLKDACADAREWAREYPSLQAAWDACQKPEWMMWALNKLRFNDDKKLRAFACWCVRETPIPDGRKVWDLLTDDRSRRAVEVAERFIRDEATAEELAAARDAAWDAARDAARDAAWDAARDAAWAAQANALREIIGNPFADEAKAEAA
jgi:hypothetical protein